MPRASVPGENASLNGLDGTGTVNVIPDAGLNVADPGTTGASENALTGGYGRVAASWNAGANGTKTNSSTMQFSTLGTIPVTHFSLWSALTAGVYALGGQLASPVTAQTITIAPGALSLQSS